MAALAAAGGANAEVAAELFLSGRTVEKALTGLSATLRIRSRRDLARELALKR